MVFSTDGVHPHVETGHRVYSETIAQSWPAIRDASGPANAHTLPTALRADNWELAQQVPINPEMLRGKWQQLPEDQRLSKQFQRNMPAIWVAREPGDALEFSFEGTSIAVFDILGPDGGSLKVQIDDRKPTVVNRIDGYCTYYRMSKLNIGSDLPNAVHHVRIELLPNELDKREILFERNRDDFDKNPKKYTGSVWYAGSLLVIGKVIVK
jgi:hypothetical protein